MNLKNIVFSRKGFDSSYGGSPSPILEDGTIISFPIPNENSSEEYDICYKELNPLGYNIGEMINDLAKNTKIKKDYNVVIRKLNSNDKVHLDPDIYYDALPKRDKNWRGLFGQDHASQGHLHNQNVSIGDLFLFYGLYRRVIKNNGKYEYDKHSKPVHLIWGWMQIGDKVEIKPEDIENVRNNNLNNLKYPWASYHPHYHFSIPTNNNTLYIANETLSIKGVNLKGVKGYGVFKNYNEKRQLTDPEGKNLTNWRFPAWMYKKGQPCPLTYNAKNDWYIKNGYAKLNAYTRGQEYVFKCTDYSKVYNWIEELLSD